MPADLSRRLNALGLLALSAVLAFAFGDQLLLGDMPCPLCLIQRGAFVLAGFGLALNVRFGPRPSHYGVMMLAGLVGLVAAGRQTLLHIVPGSGSYGDPFLGLHFYSWAAILFFAIVVGGAAMLLSERQFEAPRRPLPALSRLALASLALAALMALGNGVSTVLECGNGLCPDNPTTYILLDELRGKTGSGG